MPDDDKGAGRAWHSRVECIEYAIRKEKGRGYLCKRHQHRARELLYVDYGRARVRMDREDFIVAPGECLVVAPNRAHSISGANGAPVDFLNVVFRGRLPARLAGKVLALTDDERRLLCRLKTEGEQRPLHFRQLMRLLLNTFLLLLDRRLQGGRVGPGPSPDNRRQYRSRVVERALSLLLARRTRPLDTPALAGEVGVSPSHLRFLVKRETGRTLRQHLREARLQAARRLLRESDANVDEVARRVGYDSVPHFCTIFKRATHLTPLAYARSLKR